MDATNASIQCVANKIVGMLRDRFAEEYGAPSPLGPLPSPPLRPRPPPNPPGKRLPSLPLRQCAASPWLNCPLLRWFISPLGFLPIVAFAVAVVNPTSRTPGPPQMATGVGLTPFHRSPPLSPGTPANWNYDTTDFEAFAQQGKPCVNVFLISNGPPPPPSPPPPPMEGGRTHHTPPFPEAMLPEFPTSPPTASTIKPHKHLAHRNHHTSDMRIRARLPGQPFPATHIDFHPCSGQRVFMLFFSLVPPTVRKFRSFRTGPTLAQFDPSIRLGVADHLALEMQRGLFADR